MIHWKKFCCSPRYSTTDCNKPCERIRVFPAISMHWETRSSFRPIELNCSLPLCQPKVALKRTYHFESPKSSPRRNKSASRAGFKWSRHSPWRLEQEESTNLAKRSRICVDRIRLAPSTDHLEQHTEDLRSPQKKRSNEGEVFPTDRSMTKSACSELFDPSAISYEYECPLPLSSSP